MRSMHTQQTVPVEVLAERGVLSHIGGDSYELAIPANPKTGTGPITSYWTTEAGEQVKFQSAIEIKQQ